jgi:hypothetical protein
VLLRPRLRYQGLRVLARLPRATAAPLRIGERVSRREYRLVPVAQRGVHGEIERDRLLAIRLAALADEAPRIRAPAARQFVRQLFDPRVDLAQDLALLLAGIWLSADTRSIERAKPARN